MSLGTQKHYDLCIIGTDPSGLSLAQAYSLLGKSVCLITQNQKPVFEQALEYSMFLSAVHHGSPLKEAQNRIKTLREDNRFEKILRSLKATGVDVYEEQGFFEDKDVFYITQANVYVDAAQFILGLGLSPVASSISGIETTEPFQISDLFDSKPDFSSITLYGSHFDCVEEAQLLKKLGYAVTLITPKRLLPQEDWETYRFYLSRLVEAGIRVREHTSIKQIDGTRHELTIEDRSDVLNPKADEKLAFEKILFASHYTVNFMDMGLAKAGVAYSTQRIHANHRLQTSNPRIYAVGVCATGIPFLRTGDIHTGFFIKKSLFKIPFIKKPEPKSYSYMTYPECFKFGLSEQEARMKGGIRVYRLPYSDGIVPVLEGHDKGFIKIITNKRDVILGGVIAGEHASYVAQSWLLATQSGLKLRTIAGLSQNSLSYTDLNKKLAASSLLPTLLSDKTKKVVRFLERFG